MTQWRFKPALALFLIAFSLTSDLSALSLSELNKPEKQGKIQVSNRIIARVNGRPISLLDVVKKLDVVFYREYPQYTHDAQARYEFYIQGLKPALDDVVNKELILADAYEKKMPLSQGDVREEMEQTFGPNIVATLDSMGLSFDEAKQMVGEDITIRRMLWARVNARAMTAIGPQRLRDAYELLAKELEESREWHYRVVSIRGDNEDEVQETARRCHSLLVADAGGESLDTLADNVEPAGDSVKINVSSEFQHTVGTISKAHEEGISGLKAGTVGDPILQQSRSGKDKVYRIYVLNDIIDQDVPAFDEVENKLMDQLTSQEMVRGNIDYLKQLRDQYEVEMLISDKVRPEDLFTIY